jgi:hypothetical protein
VNHFKTERKAIYDTAGIFTKFGWIFREQPIVDIGVDALVETPIEEDGQIKIFGLQIKGGEANFQKKKTFITFYFSERHYLYWNAICENYPLFIVLQDSSNNRIYWQHYSFEKITKTPKNYKIDIPYNNILNIDSKEEILHILNGKHFLDFSDCIHESYFNLPQNQNHEINISYNLNTENKGKIQICLAYKKQKEYLDLDYIPKKKHWSIEKSFLTWENPYYYSLVDFEKYIINQFESKNRQSLKKLIRVLDSIVQGKIENIAEFIFDFNNKGNEVPKYADFIRAFEQHSKLNKNHYEAQALDHIIHFKTTNGAYEVSTYESLSEYLNYYFQNDSYDEIYTETNENIWEEIYIDPGIEKSKFIPVMQNEWEHYWTRLYDKIGKEIGSTEHLSVRKEESWKRFKSFVDLFNDADNAIELAYDFDDMVLYPMAVITMLKIFDLETCFDEYCEYEFFGISDWESIEIYDIMDSPLFFIRPCEF